MIIIVEWDARSILSSLGFDFEAEGHNKPVRGVAPIGVAAKDDLTFCSSDGEKAMQMISGSSAGTILCKKNVSGLVNPKEGAQLIFLDNPRFAFVRVLNEIEGKKKLTGISAKSSISENAEIGSDCYIGDYVVIGNNCKIGKGTVICDRVSIVQNSSIGNNCMIQSGVSIGADGFAFERHQSGKLERFPHIKGVKIGNDVEVCANSSIARGSLSDTVIGDGTKIDAVVHIAHNVVVGKNCELTAGTVIGGSACLGNMCWTGLNSTLKDHVKLGNNVIVASGASVIHDVQDYDIVAGVPAKSIKHKVTSRDLFLMAGQKKEGPVLS